MRAALFLVCLPLLFLLAGCGGGGGGGAVSSALTPVQLDVRWAPRSRSVDGPASALSAVVTLSKASPDGSNFTFTVNRNSDPAGYITRYTSPRQARVGTWDLFIEFLSQPDGAGSSVATAELSVVIQPDGNGIGTFAPTGVIDSVEVPAGQTVQVSEQKELIFTAFDDHHTVVAVSPGSAFLRVVSGMDRVSNNGTLITGLANGSASVVVSVDGKQSLPQAIQVMPSVTVNAIGLMTNDIVYDPHSGKIYACLPSSLPNGNSIVAIDPATGTVGTPIFVGSEPNRLAVSDDGQYLYVGLLGAAAVRRVLLPSLTPDITFSLGNSQFSGPFIALDLAVVPGNPRAVAVAKGQYSLPSSAGVSIYDDGVERAAVLDQFSTRVDRLVFGASADTLYGFNNESSDFTFSRMHVDSSGVYMVDQTPQLIGGFGQSIHFAAGKVYADSGSIVDPQTLQLSGTLPAPPQFSRSLVAPAVDINRIFRVTYDNFSGTPALLHTYDASTLLEIAYWTMPNVQLVSPTPDPTRLLRWGAHGLAFRTPTQVILIPNPPGI